MLEVMVFTPPPPSYCSLALSRYCSPQDNHTFQSLGSISGSTHISEFPRTPICNSINVRFRTHDAARMYSNLLTSCPFSVTTSGGGLLFQLIRFQRTGLRPLLGIKKATHTHQLACSYIQVQSCVMVSALLRPS
jgi:hypothetical protein